MSALTTAYRAVGGPGEASRPPPIFALPDPRRHQLSAIAPFEVGNRVLISSHRKLLSSKAMVVSVAETPETRFRQARLREASASKPSMKCRKRIRRCQNRGGPLYGASFVKGFGSATHVFVLRQFL